MVLLCMILYKDKEINAKKMVMRENSPILKKLPILKDNEFGSGKKSKKLFRSKIEKNSKILEYKDDYDSDKKNNGN